MLPPCPTPVGGGNLTLPQVWVTCGRVSACRCTCFQGNREQLRATVKSFKSFYLDKVELMFYTRAMKTGVASLPLHSGKAPAWLFQRMVQLSREMTLVIIGEYGVQEMLRRLSDPFWFQAFGCVLGFDWHSSGLTTTVCGALKEGLRGVEHEAGLYVAGGKGAASRKTPSEIVAVGDYLIADSRRLVYASKMAAKVDNTAIQDGYQLYHHSFFFTEAGQWAVVQQGMNTNTGYARRYHWLSEGVQSFVCEPHAAVCCDKKEGNVLNMVACEAERSRRATTDLARTQPLTVMQEMTRLKTLRLPAHHHVSLMEIDPARLGSVLITTYERQPENFEQLLAVPGLGAKSLRALALIGELLYGAPPSWRDPARFSFAHGGKDGHPYAVDRTTYDRSIAILRTAVQQAKVGNSEKREALRRLDRFEGEPQPPAVPTFASSRIRETTSGQMAIQGQLPLSF